MGLKSQKAKTGKLETFKMLNTEKLFQQLKQDEGVVYEVYLDHLGKPTFGIGHLITGNDIEYGEPVGTPVSEKRVKQAFEDDCEVAISECIVLYGPKFTEFPEEVKQVLANMMFNLGRPRLSKFVNFNNALAKGKWVEASNEGRDSKWYRQVTNRAERLMTRLENV